MSYDATSIHVPITVVLKEDTFSNELHFQYIILAHSEYGSLTVYKL